MNFIEKIISDELIYALGWTMVHSLWQGFLVAILLGVAMIGLQKKSSKVRYEAAYFALFLVFITSISTFIYLYDSVATGLEINQTLILDGVALTIEGTESVQSFFQSTINYFNTHMPMIVTIWLVGAGFFLLRLMGGLAYVEKLKHQDQNELEDKWQVTFEKLMKRLPIRQTVRVVESGLATVPMVVGYFKPIILMPIGVVNQLTPQEVEAVLAHELAHIYRNDYLLNILQSLIEVLFYYHPAVWWISANVRNERENCCDDIAVQICGNSLAYVKALVTLEEIKPRPSLAMAFSGKKNQLLNRVKRILNQPQNKSNIMEKFTATCLLLAVVLVLSVSANNGIANDPELADEIAQKEEVLESIPEADAQPRQEAVLEEVPITVDTLPKRFQGDGNFSYASDGETLQMKYEDGEIVKLRINGEKIAKKDFHKYHDDVIELLERTPEAPPSPPSPPNVPWHDTEEDWASEEGMDIFTNGRKSIVTHDEEGNKVIILEDEDGSESKIILRNGIIKIDGEDFEFGTLPDDLEKITLFGDASIMNGNIDLSIPELAYVLPDLAEIPDMSEIDFVMPDIAEIPDFPEMPEFNTDELIFEFDTIPPSLTDWSNYNNLKNLTEEEKEEIREEMKEAREEYQEARREYRERQLEAMQEYREQLAEAREEQQEAMREMREMREEMREARERARESQREALQEARESAQEARERARENQREAREEGMAMAREYRKEARKKNNVWKKSFEQQMRNDGFIDSDGDYDFRMKHNSLKINGQKQSNAMLDKYIQLYEDATGKNLGDRFSIKIKNDGSNQSTSISVDH